MKVSVSLPDDDIVFLDEYAQRQGYPSRSAVVHRAVRLLRATELGASYEAAWDEWSRAQDDEGGNAVSGDGLVAG